jgi:hypothetical protein
MYPHRLWSLGEMLRFYARPFLEARNVIRSISTAVGFVDLRVVNFGAATVVADQISTLCNCLDEMGLSISRARAQKVAALLAPGDSSIQVAELQSAIKGLDDLIEEEIEAVCFLSLSPHEAAYFYPQTPLFGVDVQAKFPSAAFEIEEAAKCYALGRGTASAFHSIRGLEAAIRSIARCLGIPDPTKAHGRNWGAMLGTVRTAIEQRWPTSSDRLAGDGQFFDEAYAALAAIRNPWRNATMHLDQKYTTEEARYIFEVVGGFMRKLASRCDEDGEPKA